MATETNTDFHTTAADALQIANTIRQQIDTRVLWAIGAHEFGFIRDQRGGLTFKTRILPMRKDGTRGTRPRIMRMTITLTGDDLYDIEVGYLSQSRWVTHYRESGLYWDALTPTILALDSDTDGDPINRDIFFRTT